MLLIAKLRSLNAYVTQICVVGLVVSSQSNIFNLMTEGNSPRRPTVSGIPQANEGRRKTERAGN